MGPAGAGSVGGDWGIGTVELESGPLLVRYNASMERLADPSTFPIKIGMAVPFNDPNPGGMPNPDEAKQVQAVEDEILRQLGAVGPYAHALVLTTGVFREFVFYVPPDFDVKAVHEAIMAQVETHKVQCHAQPEPDWSTWRDWTP